MRRFFNMLANVVAYSAAALVILLAVAVGLFRLFLPRLPEYQEEIKGWASNAIGMEVEFSGMNARWGLSGPELEFYDTELIRPDNKQRAIAADVVSIGISVNSLIFDRAFVVDRVVIRDTSLEVRQLESGGWSIQGTLAEELPSAHAGGPQRLYDMDIVGEDIEIRFSQLDDERPRFIRVARAVVNVDENRIAFDASIRPSEDLGREVVVSATQLLDVPREERNWDVAIEAEDIKLAGLSNLRPASGQRVLSGEGDLDVSLVLANGSVSNATADFDFAGISFVEKREFDLSGRLELVMSLDGWLVAAEDFRVVTDTHEWPESSLRAEASVDSAGKIAMLNMHASYFRLSDTSLILPMLPENLRIQIAELAPSGQLRDLDATISEIGTDNPYFDISVDLEDAGFASSERRPGVRGFTGRIRGNSPGGRIEIQSSDMVLDLPQVLSEPADIALLDGMIIWRSSGELTRFTTPGLHLRNAIFETRGSGELSFYDDRPAPEIDFESTFSVTDVSAIYPYLPHKIMKPKLRNWFEGSFVKGSIPRGTLRMNGPLDKRFLRDGGGRLLAEGSVRNLTLKFQPQWPAVERADVEVVLDNTRLYSVRNRSVSAGNNAVDVQLEIADLFNPVLTINALTTGTLDTIRRYAMQSPLNDLLGGHLERLTVAGDATFQFDLNIPLKNAKSTTIDGLLRSNNGSLSIAGFPAPVEDLIGEVRITREYIESDNLGGRFLGEEVSFAMGPSDDPRIFAVAGASGTVTATALVEELGVPLEGLIAGSTAYDARILFPRGKQEPPEPFAIEIYSDLTGLEFELPDPVRKPTDIALDLSADIRFRPGGEAVETTGEVDDLFTWDIGFNRVEGAWDLDRGVVTLGDDVLEPAETRGLHIRGETSTVRLDEWLNLSRSGEKKTGAAERIRSVDLNVADLFAIGQHLQGHRVRVDRSARDWLVQLEGENVKGSVFVPYDFGSDRELVVEMERMHLPGDDVSPPSASVLDPRKLPPIVLQAEDFSFGNRFLGNVELKLLRIADGLETETLLARDATFEIVGTARWVVDESEALGSRTYMTATLNSTDVETTLERLDYAPGISGESMGILSEISWAGGPRADFLDTLDGEVEVRLEEGQLEEVEPGAGRIFGLMSFVALPRRLSLDFRDVFNEGFAYDAIAGNFTLVDGNASTCDLSLEGPAADIGIVGQADLVGREYEQGVVISANVGNTLPIVGAVEGGPAGAAAMLIFSQIFKKPLQEVGQVFYAISGPWDEPVIEPVSSDNFVRYGELAGCLNKTERE